PAHLHCPDPPQAGTRSGASPVLHHRTRHGLPVPTQAATEGARPSRANRQPLATPPATLERRWEGEMAFTFVEVQIRIRAECPSEAGRRPDRDPWMCMRSTHTSGTRPEVSALQAY